MHNKVVTSGKEDLGFIIPAFGTEGEAVGIIGED